MYQPIISATVVEYREINQLCSELFLSFKNSNFDDENTIKPFMLEFKNTGRGEIRDFRVEIESCSVVSNPFHAEDEFDLSDSFILGDGFFNFFPINSSNYFLINIPSQNYLFEINTPLRISITLIVDISGFITDTIHSYVVNFYIDIYLYGPNKPIETNDLTIGYIGSKKKKHTHGVG